MCGDSQCESYHSGSDSDEEMKQEDSNTIDDDGFETVS
jgi:hypothetical protein